MDDALKAAIDQLAGWWRAERAAARAAFAAQRAGTTRAWRVRRGLALDALTVVEHEPAARDRVRLALAVPDAIDLDGLRIGPGDPILIEALGHAPRRAVFVRRDGQRVVVVMIDADRDDLAQELAFGPCAIEACAPEVTFDRGATALARAREARGDTARLLEVLGGIRAPHQTPATPWTPRDPDLDDAQRAAVDDALRASEVALVWGPPGTGKTRTLVEIIHQLVARGARVLCTAASNTAVDNLGARLAAAGLAPVRLGHPARVAAALDHLTLDARVDADGATALVRDWRDRARDLRKRAGVRRDRALYAEANALERDARRELASTEEAIVARARVVLATCAGADHPVLRGLTFDAVVLDEATQAVDPIALCALLRAPRVILAGDPQQLPPTVIDPAVARAGLASTFFERLVRAHERDAATGVAPNLLVRQHRMHADIMRFPSAQSYGGRLVAAPAVAAHRLEDLGVALDPLRPAAAWFIDCAGTGWTDRRGGLEPDDDEIADPSTWNPGFAERTAAEVRRLISRGLAPDQIAVIAAYDAQVRRLRALLAVERAAGLEIATVDAFQGREQEAVVVDLVRANDRGEIGFLAETRRMNVALTRARRGLIVIGDSATLGDHPYYAAFVAAMDDLGGHGSAWSDDAPPL
jgi:superfamily I DNA and/or RNA helicase